MTVLDDRDLAAIALTSRLVDSKAKPLSAQEFWALRRDIEPSALLGMSVNEVVSTYSVARPRAERITRLLDRAIGLAIVLEKLDHSGIWTLTGVTEGYPKRLHTRLGNARPVVLHGVGDNSLLTTEGVGIVGLSGDVLTSRVTRDLAEHVARSGRSVITGLGPGVDADAVDAASDALGSAIGIPAEALERIIARPRIRQAVARGRICLVTPYAPAAQISSTNAMWRTKIIYGLSQFTIVVACDQKRGDVWAGAIEALRNGYGRVVTWIGAGSGPGNRALIEEGADQLDDVAHLQVLLGGDSAAVAAGEDGDSGDQLPLDFDVSR